jgi:hypothetical protein
MFLDFLVDTNRHSMKTICVDVVPAQCREDTCKEPCSTRTFLFFGDERKLGCHGNICRFGFTNNQKNAADLVSRFCVPSTSTKRTRRNAFISSTSHTTYRSTASSFVLLLSLSSGSISHSHHRVSELPFFKLQKTIKELHVPSSQAAAKTPEPANEILHDFRFDYYYDSNATATRRTAIIVVIVIFIIASSVTPSSSALFCSRLSSF